MEYLTFIMGAVLLFFLLAQLNFYMGHSDEHKRSLRLQVLCGLPILAGCSWMYCLGDHLNLGALYLFGCYCCLCMVYNGFHNLTTRGIMSTDISEHLLFGWFKMDDFFSEIAIGAIGCYFCFQAFISGSGTIYQAAAFESPKPAAHHAKVSSSHSAAKSNAHAHVVSHASSPHRK